MTVLEVSYKLYHLVAIMYKHFFVFLQTKRQIELLVYL